MSVSLYGSGNTVIQAIYGSTPTTYSTTSTSAVATGYTLSITPQSTNSKILAIVQSQMDSGTSNNQAVLFLYRGGSSITATSCFSSAGRILTGIGMTCLDSPATTSSVTYSLYISAGSGSSITLEAGATVTLLEISGS